MMLNLFIGFPLVCGLAAFLMKDRGARAFAMTVTLLQLGIGLALVGGPEESRHIHQAWIPELGLNWALGIDGANILLVVLTPLICLLAMMASPRSLANSAGMGAGILLLDGFLSGLFLSQNLGLFYLFFEAMLLPALMLVASVRN